MKTRYQLNSDKDGAWLVDTETEQCVYSIISKPNETTARCEVIRKAASWALHRTKPMTDAEAFYWLTHATELAADNAMAEAMDDCPDDCFPEDHCPEIDTARFHIYEAQWTLAEINQ